MRILFIADTHLASSNPESHSFWPHQLERLPAKERKSLYARIRDLCFAAYHACLGWARTYGPWDLIIHLDDMTGGWREQGLVHRDVETEARQCMGVMRGLAREVLVTVGNHETGYGHPGSLAGSGINSQAVTTCQAVFGPLWWARECGPLLMIGVASPLTLYNGPDPVLIGLKREQEEFLRTTLVAHAGQPWILCAHDPGTPGRLTHIIGPHMRRLQRFIFADLHASWAGKARRIASILRHAVTYWSSESRVMFHAHLRSIMCPSTAPLWCRGHRMLQGELVNGTLKLSEVRRPLTNGTRELPVTNPIRCAWWMVASSIFSPLRRKRS